VSVAACAGLAAVLVFAAGCGNGSKAVSAIVDTPTVEPKPEGLQPEDVAGAWVWSHITETEGVRRVESERWQIKASEQALVGFYEREVTFLSVDGVPFDCNQALSYKLRTLYEIEGTLGKDTVAIRERDYQAPESPCERGFRQLAEYTGELIEGKLVLRWDDGEQTLARDEDAADRELPSMDVAGDDVGGEWQWSTRTETRRDGIVRVESESWDLSLDDEEITGSYDRKVTVFYENGDKFRCNKDREYTYTDAYTVRGSIVEGEVNITEIDVAPQKHKCLIGRDDRHLDHAVGRVEDGYLVLTWRGRHTQILHRPPVEAKGEDAEAAPTTDM
jgi:hypothetical protein